ncbi:LOW QUALITY PROTEIN: Acyl-ACP thioesterase [Dillenia turbinata]|uniref:Acyl-[acyl-carrier-protein] hydrolase n=1 Tax=Dillenia turbinata TaxID=194707 RepID=A0AAN8ZF56_9MAGN
MASLSYTATFFDRYSTSRGNQKLNNIDTVGTSMMPTTKLHLVSSASVVTTYNTITYTEKEQIRQNIPTKKQFLDPFRQGLIIEGGRQTVVIRSSEVGPDKTARLESILNLLQETALNHVWMSGLLGDGFGATHGMMRNNLIRVVSRMQVQVDQYPIWQSGALIFIAGNHMHRFCRGEVVEIDTCVGASGKNGMRSDWQIRSHVWNSTSVMMNEQTRHLSKMPEEVRAEISPWFIEKQAIQENAPEKIVRLDDNAKYMNSDLMPKRSDQGMNQHVNNVKYVRWMLETIPDEFLEKHQLSGITLEFRYS